jgi:hypothetical protein
VAAEMLEGHIDFRQILQGYRCERECLNGGTSLAVWPLRVSARLNQLTSPAACHDLGPEKTGQNLPRLID